MRRPATPEDPDTAPRKAFVSLGSNVEPTRHLRLAVERLRERFGDLVLSSVYRNKAEGFEGDDFLNLVVGFATRESPDDIVAELERLHAEAGRVRENDAFGPRTLDIDLLIYGDEVIEALRVPRADITRYAFVLGPLAEIAPDLRHPLTGETMSQLWQHFDKASHPLERLPTGLL